METDESLEAAGVTSGTAGRDARGVWFPWKSSRSSWPPGFKSGWYPWESRKTSCINCGTSKLFIMFTSMSFGTREPVFGSLRPG